LGSRGCLADIKHLILPACLERHPYSVVLRIFSQLQNMATDELEKY